jgi:hypothetical protein
MGQIMGRGGGWLRRVGDQFEGYMWKRVDAKKYAASKWCSKSWRMPTCNVGHRFQLRSSGFEEQRVLYTSSEPEASGMSSHNLTRIWVLIFLEQTLVELLVDGLLNSTKKTPP